MTTPATSRLIVPVSDRDHIRGPATAPVTLLEYGDYECPYCGRAYPIVEELIETLGDQLRFAFRHFPLTQVHPHAQLAAEAAEAAGAQGKFWEMHHTLFTHQNALDAASMVRYAAAIGLGPVPFAAALESGTYRPKVREDFMSGVRSGVNGTPTFFINDLRYDGPHELVPMMAATRAAVA